LRVDLLFRRGAGHCRERAGGLVGTQDARVRREVDVKAFRGVNLRNNARVYRTEFIAHCKAGGSRFSLKLPFQGGETMTDERLNARCDGVTGRQLSGTTTWFSRKKAGTLRVKSVEQLENRERFREELPVHFNGGNVAHRIPREVRLRALLAIKQVHRHVGVRDALPGKRDADAVARGGTPIAVEDRGGHGGERYTNRHRRGREGRDAPFEGRPH
ncbi:hypothetical protein OUZ56_032611, partial [Daphnia magna]